MSIDLNNWRHPLQGGRSQIPSWARPDSSWNEIALEARDSAYFQTVINITDADNKTSERKIEGVIGLGSQGQPVLFSKRAVEHLLEDKRSVKQVQWNTKKEKTRAGIEYTIGWFEKI